jgi:hypothetical protein
MLLGRMRGLDLTLPLIIGFALLAAPRAQAGAWVMGKGEGQAITTLSLYRSDGGFDDQGQPVPAARYRRTEIATYLEYGLTHRLTIGFQPRYKWTSTGVGALRSEGKSLGDLDVFARRHLFTAGAWVGAVQGLIKFPTYERSRLPAPGNGRREYELRLAMGRNIKIAWPSDFIDAEFAYRRGTRGLADQIRAEATIGLRPSSRLMILVKGYRTVSQGLGDGLPGSSYDLDRLELSGVLRLTRSVSLELGAGRDLSGDRVGLGRTVNLGLWLRF